MATIYSVEVENKMVGDLGQLSGANNIWLSTSKKDLYYGTGRNLVEDNVNTLSFYHEDDAQRFIKALELSLDQK